MITINQTQYDLTTKKGSEFLGGFVQNSHLNITDNLLKTDMKEIVNKAQNYLTKEKGSEFLGGFVQNSLKDNQNIHRKPDDSVMMTLSNQDIQIKPKLIVNMMNQVFQVLKLKPQTIPGISIEKIDHIIDKLKTAQKDLNNAESIEIIKMYINKNDKWNTNEYTVKQTIDDRINQLEAIKNLTPDSIKEMFVNTVNGEILDENTTHESLKAEFIKAFNDTYQNIISADKKEYVNKELGKVFDSLMNYICIDDQSKQITVHKEDFDVSAGDTIKAFLIQFAKFVLTAGILTIIEAIKGESVFLPSAQEEKNRAKSFVEQKASEAIDPDVMKLIAV